MLSRNSGFTYTKTQVNHRANIPVFGLTIPTKTRNLEIDAKRKNKFLIASEKQ